MDSARKPFKLTLDGNIKKGVVCGSLNELALKANTHFGIKDDEVMFGLEDGTEILDDDYLMSLESQTVVVVRRKNEPSSGHYDETDRATALSYDAVEILERVRKHPCSLVLLSEEELDVVTSADCHKIKLPGVSSSEIECLIDACDRELERKQREKNALDLMDILRKVNDSCNEHK